MIKDEIIHGFCCDDTISVAAVTAGELVACAKEVHSLSRTATAALGRQLMMTALLSSRLKDERESVTTILAGNGVGGNLVCVGKPNAIVKGCAGEPTAELPPKSNGKLDVSGYVGDTGKLTVVREFAQGEPYVGVCGLVSGEVAEDFAEYFTVSEQQPSIVYLGVNERADTGEVLSAGGLWVQAMPGCPDDNINAVVERAQSFTELAARLRGGEALVDILEYCFNGLGFRSINTLVPKLSCDCSRSRMERAMISIGHDDLAEIIEQDGQAELVCHFCNKHYFFNKQELEALLKEAGNVRQ